MRIYYTEYVKTDTKTDIVKGKRKIFQTDIFVIRSVDAESISYIVSGEYDNLCICFKDGEMIKTSTIYTHELTWDDIDKMVEESIGGDYDSTWGVEVAYKSRYITPDVYETLLLTEHKEKLADIVRDIYDYCEGMLYSEHLIRKMFKDRCSKALGRAVNGEVIVREVNGKFKIDVDDVLFKEIGELI